MGGRVIERLRAIVDGDEPTVLLECRHCGAAVESPGEPCPDCGTAEIARFVL